MNVTPITLEVANESIPMVELAANPDNVSMTFRVFLDTNEDGNYSNGTSIAPKFNITAINEFGLSLEVTEDMYDSQTGELTVDLSVGDYRIDMIADDPSDENATEYRRFANNLPNLNIGLAPSGEPLDIAIEPQYLVHKRDYGKWIRTREFYSLVEKRSR